jgi:SAM-dependent methyltransferase
MLTNESRWRAINAFQRDEILGLAKMEADAVQAAALRPHYTGIGDWLPRGKGGRVLELGCGPGRYVALLAGLGYDVVGVDPIAFPLWDEIKSHHNVEFMDNVSAESLPFADAFFDHIACVSALLYFSDAERALSEMRRVLKPGGRLYVRTVNSRNLTRRWRRTNIDPDAQNYFDKEELTTFLVKGGFEVKRIFTYGFFLPIWTDFWWYLCNGPISISMQERLSTLTPEEMRVTVVAYAQLPKRT